MHIVSCNISINACMILVRFWGQVQATLRAAARESAAGATKDDKSLEKKKKDRGKGQAKKPRGRPRGSGRGKGGGRGRARGGRGRGGGEAVGAERAQDVDVDSDENLEMKVLAQEDQEIQRELNLQDDGDVGGPNIL